MDIHKFYKKFNDEYQFLYDNYDNVAGYKEAVDYFDMVILAQHYNFVAEFNNYRGDVITSDREAAAFVFTFSICCNK